MAYEQYFADPGQAEDPRVAALLASDLSGLPPAFVLSAEYEIMRDDIERYAERLGAAGVPVELRRYEGTIHPFLSMAGVVDVGRLALDDAAEALRRMLS